MEQDNYCRILLWGDNCVGQSGITVWENLPVVEELELVDLDDLQGLFQAEAFCDFMVCRSFSCSGWMCWKGKCVPATAALVFLLPEKHKVVSKTSL